MSLTAYHTGKTEGACQWCGLHHGAQCPSVKAIEYYPDGKIKRVEFRGESDYSPSRWTVPYPVPEGYPKIT